MQRWSAEDTPHAVITESASPHATTPLHALARWEKARYSERLKEKNKAQRVATANCYRGYLQRTATEDTATENTATANTANTANTATAIACVIAGAPRSHSELKQQQQQQQ